MSIKWRILTGFLILYAVGFYFLYDFIANEIRPRYLETVEESLNDTANILASIVEEEISGSSIKVSRLQPVIEKVYEKRISSRIYALHKTGVSLHIYITDITGRVIYSSHKSIRAGEDFSQWRDVKLTLNGKYGARTSLLDENKPDSKSIFVAAPIRYNGRIIGVLTVVKPEESVALFIKIAKRNAAMTGAVSGLIFLLFSLILTFWINHPINRLKEFINSLRLDKRSEMPRFSEGEIQSLAETFRDVWKDLKGEKFIEDYIQTLTHELKSPLSSIRGSAELLEEDLPDEKREAFLRNILRESRRMEGIIERMLELSAMENRESLKNIEKINIIDEINEALENIFPECHRKNIRVEKVFPSTAVIEGERFLLRHAILNLLQNALRFTNDGGEILVKLTKSAADITIEIADNGDRIPEYALEKIFTKFYSLPSRETGRKSTGLGLPFVKEIASLHHGTVFVKNNTGNGVTATLTLPLTLAEQTGEKKT